MAHGQPLAVRFWQKVNKTDGCWEWTGGLQAMGYGLMYASGSSNPQLAHRVSWRLESGDIPAGMFVCHRCDNRRCVRPAHLFLGSAKDNTRDMMRKGRNRTGANKLRAWDVIDIRTLHAFGMRPRDLMEGFGVSRTMVNSIVSRRSWKEAESCSF